MSLSKTIILHLMLITVAFSQKSAEFAIYLFADSSFQIPFDQNFIDSYTLVDTPIISADDLISYNWSNHGIILSEKGMIKNREFFNKFLRPNLIPFIACVGKERIYIGLFVSLCSSSLPKYPHILAPPFRNDKSKGDKGYYLRFEKSFMTSTQNDIDIRNDTRIYNSLKKSRVLKE